MNVELSALEARVLGCLIEKQITTPEQYPMSLNALTNACNQKSNRDPVLQLPEVEVQALIDGLSRKHLLLEKSGFGSRVPKYQQRFCNTEFSVFQFTPQERAIICELLLRGPQTPGELRSRAARMAEFADAAAADHLGRFPRFSRRGDLALMIGAVLDAPGAGTSGNVGTFPTAVNTDVSVVNESAGKVRRSSKNRQRNPPPGVARRLHCRRFQQLSACRRRASRFRRQARSPQSMM